MAGDAGVSVGKVKGKKGGEPAEGAGRVIMVGGAEDEGVVGAAVGAGRARAGAKHGGSLCEGPGVPAVGRAAAPGRHRT